MQCYDTPFLVGLDKEKRELEYILFMAMGDSRSLIEPDSYSTHRSHIPGRN